MSDKRNNTQNPPVIPRRGPPGAAMHASGGKPKNTGAALKRTTAFLLQSRVKLALAVFMTAIAVTLSTLGPWQLGKATDLVVSSMLATGTVDFAGIAVHLVIVAILYLGASALNWRQAWLINDVVQSLSRNLRQQAENKLSRLPLAWFDRQPHGEVLSRVTNDIDNITQSLQQLMSQLLMATLTLIGVIVMMLILSPMVALVALAALALAVVITRLLARRAQPGFAGQWRYTGELNAEVEEAFTGHTLVQVFGHRRRTEVRFEKANQALKDHAFRAQLIAGVIQPVSMLVSNLAFITVVIFGALRVVAGAFSVGELQAFIQYIRQTGQPIQQVAGMATLVQSGLASAERVFELLDMDEMPPETDALAAAEKHKGHVRFEHVRFRYEKDKPLFEDVSLEALPGQTVAIVGPTGAGKTTLVNLLMRFYEVDGGQILLDGIDTAKIAKPALRRQFGMVLQDSWLFSGTLKENIAYGRPDASDDEIIEAAKACHVDGFASLLPDGYATVMDETGGALSAGQKQLVTIARAFLMRPAVLILDEATSSVDSRTELLVQQAMNRLRTGRTSFVIAHRLSTIRDADVIAYMEGGNVVEKGNHSALLAAKGRYFRLYRSQFERAEMA
ncbi:ABC transporter ATP-binding protein [Martelella sp. HB161492]|uniref:ABC transporter ATP-binding protein n=1 Tax=Martelella sp. HB161492 TaxID=2720726 RepID=UPI001590906A|nr:ABC transporter ATP-binding protein [Martelella sp. HB161492]